MWMVAETSCGWVMCGWKSRMQENYNRQSDRQHGQKYGEWDKKVLRYPCAVHCPTYFLCSITILGIFFLSSLLSSSVLFSLSLGASLTDSFSPPSSHQSRLLGTLLGIYLAPIWYFPLGGKANYKPLLLKVFNDKWDWAPRQAVDWPCSLGDPEGLHFLLCPADPPVLNASDGSIYRFQLSLYFFPFTQSIV